ncbi:MAG: VCBS repeat-containing protein [Marinilabiliaceae bacterium]|nr:VCBS repeat-containing protein [Marinilabiliaceae bacterium]
MNNIQLKLQTPKFNREVVDADRTNSYWVEALDINGNGKSDLLGYGLGDSRIFTFMNPNWEKRLIAELQGAVGMDHADINGNGRNDVVICYQYGKTMKECDPQGGKIVWLENPGDPQVKWKHHYIGRATAMHRLRVGYFTQTEKLEVLGLPIVGKPGDIYSDVPVVLFSQPDDLSTAKEWKKTIINDKFYHIIHGVSKKQYNKTRNGSQLDSVLLASQEGITWLYYDEAAKDWKIELIGKGEQSEFEVTGYRGSANVDAGRIGDDHFAYIPTVEPFHGNKVAVYVKETDSLLTTVKWKRFVLDTFKDPDEHGEGPGHHVVCADFDGDGDDEFLVALRGPSPWQGVYYYKAIDVKNGVFAKWHITKDSAARIALADFNGDGRLDFATMGYWVPGYYETEKPEIVVFKNTFAHLSREQSVIIQAEQPQEAQTMN